MRLFVCGDIINQFSHQQFIGEKLVGKIKSCDYAIGNLEGVVSNGTNATHMQQTTETPAILREAGFNMMLLANNHICDYGQEGLSNTITALEQKGVAHIGAGLNFDEASAPQYIDIKNKKLGFINIGEAQPGYFRNKHDPYGYAWMGNPYLPEIIKTAKSKCDYLFIFIHAGLEHYTLPLSTFRDIYKSYCDWGADYVIASHPHIAQGFEHYQQSIIFYSLGNFFFPRHREAGAENIENCSFSVILDTDNTTPEIIYHSMQNLMVEIDDSPTLDVWALSKQLKADEYPALIKSQNDKAFNKLLIRLYREALLGYDYSGGFICRIKCAAKFLLLTSGKIANSERHRMLLLKRLCENESYRFLTIEYINNKYNER